MGQTSSPTKELVVGEGQEWLCLWLNSGPLLYSTTTTYSASLYVLSSPPCSRPPFPPPTPFLLWTPYYTSHLMAQTRLGTVPLTPLLAVAGLSDPTTHTPFKPIIQTLMDS